MKKMKKEEKQPVNNALADALANIKLCLLLCFGLFSLMMMQTESTVKAAAVQQEQQVNKKGKEIARAFPADIEEKPLTAYSVDYGTVNVYNDADLTQECGQVDGGRLKITARKVKGQSIYGEYTSGDAGGSGWFSLKTFVVNPDFEPVYATARDGMYAYTDGSFDEIRGTIGKYTGVIVISKEGGARQIIFETKEGYSIGFMTEGAFSNCLLYDGREKQVIADGTYLLQCGYLDDEKGGPGMKAQTELPKYQSYQMELKYISGNHYYLKNQETGKYLTAEKQFTSGNDASKQKIKESDVSALWKLSWTDEPDDEYGVFYVSRNTGSFAVQNTASRMFAGQNDEKELILMENRQDAASHWRISALKRVLNTKQPMIFTQYDPQWCGTPYGGGGSMGTAGCGVLATVNAVYALSGQYMDVMELADYAVEKNYRIVGSGTDDGIFKAACQKFGKKYNFSWDGKSGSIDLLKKKLAAGDVAVVHVQGHYVVIADYNKKKNKYLLLDSNYLPKRATSAFGDWISVDRLLSGSLEVQSFYFFKLRDTAA